MTDRFNNRASGSVDPATDGFVITPDDTQGLPETTRAIYVGTGGAITLVLSENTELSFSNVPTGSVLPVRAIAVKATGTDAADLLGLV